jgi:manganese oxidase
MRLTAVILALAATAVVSSSPINNTNLTGSYTCSGHMDGNLPYYQPQGFRFSGNVRRYYVAAEIDTWNYAPSGKYQVSFSLIFTIGVLS